MADRVSDSSPTPTTPGALPPGWTRSDSIVALALATAMAALIITTWLVAA